MITRHLKPYIALSGTSTSWSHPPPQLWDTMSKSFYPKSKSPTKNEYLSDLRIFERMCHRHWRQLKKKNSGNIWGNGNINRSTKGLHLSQGHYSKERKIHLHCKSDIFLNLAAATEVILLATVDANQCRANAWHREGPRSGCGACIINDTASSQRAHSIQGSQIIADPCINQRGFA